MRQVVKLLSVTEDRMLVTNLVINNGVNDAGDNREDDLILHLKKKKIIIIIIIVNSTYEAPMQATEA